MSRINSNVTSLQAVNRLVANQSDLTTRLQRLSTGLRINSGKDDPAGLIASETLRSEMRGISAAIDNSHGRSTFCRSRKAPSTRCRPFCSTCRT